MRRQRVPVLWGGIVVGMVFALALGAQETSRSDDAPGEATASESDGPDAGEGQGTSAVAKAVAIVYKPPPRGAPRARVGGGVRGARALPTPLALVPEHVALTSQPSPSFYWHIDGAPDDGVRVFFTLIEDGGRKPLVEKELPRPQRAGIQRIRLRDYGVQLRPGVIYQWSVALVPDPSRRSHDLVALGYVERLSASSIDAGDARAQAEAGLWYDTIETLSDESAAGPKKEWATQKRDQLFRQVGLDAAVP